MSFRSELVEILKRDEGIRLKPYKDTVGKLTIGIGRNLDDRGISEDEADYMLQNDIDLCINELASRFHWFHDEAENVQIVLISMVFNLGITRFMGFKKMIAALERGDYEDAAIEMLDSRWAVQVGDRAKRLAKLIVQ